MPMCTLRQVLLAVISCPVIQAIKRCIPIMLPVEEMGGDKIQSSLCAKLYSKVNLKKLRLQLSESAKLSGLLPELPSF